MHKMLDGDFLQGVKAAWTRAFKAKARRESRLAMDRGGDPP